MAMHEEPLTEETLDEAAGFFRAANPFSQMTWGWDTGTFLYRSLGPSGRTTSYTWRLPAPGTLP